MDTRFNELMQPGRDRGRSHRHTAFIIESLLLLIFVTASVAIVVELLGDGYAQGVKADKLSTAVSIASNEAERFTSDPTIKSGNAVYLGTDEGPEKISSKKLNEGDEVEVEDKTYTSQDPDIYVMKRKISSDSLDSGTLYNAEISIECQGEEVYSIDTSKYVSGSGESTDDDNGEGDI